eukprot:355838-Chlamydomonas_euryale.AAC.4
MPAAVLLHAARQSSGSGEPGQLRGGVPVYSGPPPGGGARPAQQKQKQQQARRHQSQLGQGNGTGEPPSGGRRGTGAAGAVPSSGHAHRRTTSLPAPCKGPHSWAACMLDPIVWGSARLGQAKGD